ncbi:MAG: nucleotidyltransferase family protein [Gemmatimonadetes bacterium]|nr:nucleotidyltransferase family protein [Gemmatimonadota bacterium]
MVRHAHGALELRRLAVAILAGDAPAAGAAAAPRFSTGAWALFLKVEQCAGPLRAAFARLGVDPPANALLDDRVRADTQRTLSTRGQLAVIGALARERSWPAVVLKGGVAAAAGEPIHLADVDVLVRTEHAASFATELSHRLGVTVEGRPTVRHLAAIAAPHALPVELHTSIDNRWTALTETAWHRILPLDGLPGLSRLAPRDHLWHMLTHVVIDHPDRRGRLRDALLIGAALAECTAEEEREMEQEIARLPYARPLADQLAFARRLTQRQRASDPFELVAFTNFWMLERERLRRIPRTPIGELIYPTVWHWVIALVAGWSNRQRLVDGLHEDSPSPSRLRVTAWLERHVPPVGKALRLGVRAIQYAVAFVLAWPLARQVRRAAKEVE